MEPPGPGLRARAAPPALTFDPASVRLALAVGALVLALTATGDIVLLAVLLAGAATDWWGRVAVFGALAAVVARWGTSSLAAVAGAQAVAGPGGWTGTAAAVASAWLATAALLAVAGGSADRWTAAAFGVTAGLAAAGPALDADPAVRAAGVAVGAVAAMLLATRVGPARVARPLALAAGAAALVLAALA